MKVLGISCFYHDAAACLVVDGEVVAAVEEERFLRIKHDNGFPIRAIEYCLDYAGLAANELDKIVFYEKPVVKFERLLAQHLEYFPRSRNVFMSSTGSWIGKKLNIARVLREELSYVGLVEYAWHHESHAASAYYLSGFSEAVVVTLDGVGEWATTTVGMGRGSKLQVEREIRFPHSLGLLYSALTAYLGFRVNNSEYKVMGLAAYGDARRYKEQMEELVVMHEDGSFELNMDYFDFGWAEHMPSEKMKELFGRPMRQVEGRIYKYHKDIAAALQERLEVVVFNLLNWAYENYESKNLCLAGGVALNSVMNGKIVERTPFEKVFVPPAPGDAGGAVGAALLGSEGKINKGDPGPYLGPEYGGYQVERVLRRNGLNYELVVEREKFLRVVAEMIVNEQVIGWFQGRMEWGPRALGNRSILASALSEEMRDIINAKVKKREMFRPFAPVILAEKVSDYFEFEGQPMDLAKYMLLVVPFREKGKKEVPAVVHVNGSGRLQAIEKEDNPLYYDLVKMHDELTGVPVIINTSFNVRGEPIVCTPQEAVDCFLGTEIDALVMDRYIVRKD